MKKSLMKFMIIGALVAVLFGYWVVTKSSNPNQRQLITTSHLKNAPLKDENKSEVNGNLTKTEAYKERTKEEATDKAKLDFVINNQKPQKLAESVTSAMKSPYERKLEEMKENNRTTVPTYDGKNFGNDNKKTNATSTKLPSYRSSVPTNRKTELEQSKVVDSNLENSSDPFNSSFVQANSSDQSTTAKSDMKATLGNESEMVKAAVFGEQTVKSGGIMRFRLLEEAIIDGKTYSRNTVFNGKCGFGQDRLFVTVDRLPIKSAGFSTVKMIVHDQDLQEGIFAPIDLTKQSTVDQAASNVNNVVSRVSSPAATIGAGVARVFQTAVNGQAKISVPDAYPVNFLITKNKAR